MKTIVILILLFSVILTSCNSTRQLYYAPKKITTKQQLLTEYVKATDVLKANGLWRQK